MWVTFNLQHTQEEPTEMSDTQEEPTEMCDTSSSVTQEKPTDMCDTSSSSQTETSFKTVKKTFDYPGSEWQGNFFRVWKFRYARMEFFGGCENGDYTKTCPWIRKVVTGAYYQCAHCSICVHASCCIGELDYETALTKPWYCVSCMKFMGFTVFGLLFFNLFLWFFSENSQFICVFFFPRFRNKTKLKSGSQKSKTKNSSLEIKKKREEKAEKKIRKTEKKIRQTIKRS